LPAAPNVFAALLKLVGLRQIEVADELGVRRSTLAGWLAGYAPMPDEAVLRTHRLIAKRLSRLTSPGERNHEGRIRSSV
jgi:transcriptional regulator with XRE-family HTH domain